MFEAVGRDPNSVDKFFIERLAGTISTLQPTTSREEVNRAPPQLPLLDHFRKDIVDTVTSLPEEQVIKYCVYMTCKDGITGHMIDEFQYMTDPLKYAYPYALTNYRKNLNTYSYIYFYIYIIQIQVNLAMSNLPISKTGYMSK